MACMDYNPYVHHSRDIIYNKVTIIILAYPIDMKTN